MYYHNGEDLNINTVKLVQTGPTASIRQPNEQFLHHFDVDLVRAVENQAETSETFGQIFAGLCFSGSRRTCGIGTKFDMQGTCNGHPATICQRSLKRLIQIINLQ